MQGCAVRAKGAKANEQANWGTWKIYCNAEKVWNNYMFMWNKSTGATLPVVCPLD
jgi:hypothetical protein